MLIRCQIKVVGRLIEAILLATFNELSNGDEMLSSQAPSERLKV